MRIRPRPAALGRISATIIIASLGLSCAPVATNKASDDPMVARGTDGPPFMSDKQSGFGSGIGHTFVIDGPPPSETDVEVGFIVSADLGENNEYFDVFLNGEPVGRMLESGGRNCPAPAEEVVLRIPSELYNEKLAQDGQIEIKAVPSSTVSGTDCVNSTIRTIVDYCGSFPCPRANIVEGPPRIVSAISQSNTSVRVVFNEPVYDGATDTGNYSILQSDTNIESAALRVIGATLSQDMTTVTLETGSQSQITYVLITTGVQDLAGNVLSPPSLLVDPTRTEFAGTPAINNGIDGDGDGLADAIETRGWTVNVTRTGGDVETRQVTSDPTLADTDGDGLDDLVEFQNRADPRRSDSDGDTLRDEEEYNVIYSSMTQQDSDSDEIDDGLEMGFFKTSPILADTDGDNLNDDRELFELFRDPRVADLPRPRITISQIRLHLDERYTYVNESGENVSVESSTSSSLSSSNSTSFGRSSTHEWGENDEGFFTLGVGGGFKEGSPFIEANAEGGAKFGTHDDNTVQVTSESSEQTQQSFEESLSRARDLSQTSTVTREVLGARLDVDVTLESAGDIAFTISNIEVTVLQPNPLLLGNVKPVASLLAASELTTGNPAVFNLGPLVAQHGPIIFSNTEVFPSLVEDLMRAPRGLLFQISNFDLTDELGRNFAFASQEARDRCAGIVINRGDDEAERVLVALNGQNDTNDIVPTDSVGGFDENGRAAGVPMDYVLQDILRLKKNQRDPDGILAGLDFRADTVAAGDDVQFVPRGTNGLLPHTVVIGAGRNGMLESTPAGDDRPDVITGYETSPTCGPGTADLVIEPLSGGNARADTAAIDDDVQLVAVGQPVAPGQAIVGPGPDGVVDAIPTGDDRAQFPGQIAKPSFITENNGGDGVVETAATGDDVQLIPVGQTGVAAFVAIIGPGPNGLIDTQPAGDEVYISPDCGANSTADGPERLVRFENRRSGEFQRTWIARMDRRVAGGDFGKVLLYPGDDVEISFVQDVDHDGLLAQAEFVYGSSDTLRDSDGDEIDDFAEVSVGWTVGVTGKPLQQVFPSPAVPDSDGDGLTDLQEQDLRRYFVNNMTAYAQIFGNTNLVSSNPRLKDSDGDGIDDKVELDGFLVAVAIRAGNDDRAQSEALGDDVQKAFVGAQVFDPGHANGGVVILPGPNRVIDSVALGDDVRSNGFSVRTSPLNPDHDGDTRPDGQERDLGGDPTNANDSDDFRDSDRDGLSDAEEEDMGWDVVIHPLTGSAQTRHVTSNKFVPDTDLDGLPDLLERLLGSDPTREDTDADGITDYNEFGHFADYVDLGLRFPGFVLDGRDSAAYGTNLNRVDTDGDTLTDRFELEEGWRVFAYGDATPREVNPSPLFPDSDLDGLRDDDEFTLKTDPHDADTDDDERLDGVDIAHCRSTGALCIPVPGSCTDCEGSNPLRPDIAVTISYSSVRISNLVWNGGAGQPRPENFDWYFTYGFAVPGTGIYEDYSELFTIRDIETGSPNCPVRSLCDACQLADERAPNYSWPVEDQLRRTITMVPGDVLILSGVTLEAIQCFPPDDDEDDNSYGSSGSASFLETYTFEALTSSGSFFEPFQTRTSTSALLTFDAEVFVLVQVR